MPILTDTSIPDLPPNTSLAGRSALITGSNQGLGYHAALLSLQLGASPVYLAVRSLSKGREARESLLADPVVKQKNPGAVVEVYELDMARWDSVTSFASKFIADRKAAGQGLDIAILNAGIISAHFELAPTGNEMVVQVNYLSTVLLSLLLLPLLESSATPEHAARLTYVTSGMHKRGIKISRCPPDDVNYLATLNEKANFDTFERYGLTKLLVIFFLRHLAKRVDANKVIINNVCPGWIGTNLNANSPYIVQAVVWIMQTTTGNPVEKGAACYVHAVECLGKESHGLFYQRMKLIPYSDFALSEEGEKTQEKTWKETMEILDKVSPGISSQL